MRNEIHRHDGNDSVTPVQHMAQTPLGQMVPARPIEGMSTRERFAESALCELVRLQVGPAEAGRLAVEYADALLLALCEDTLEIQGRRS